MKYSLIFLTSCFLFFSCSKEEEPEPEPVPEVGVDQWTEFMSEDQIPFTNKAGMVSFVIDGKAYLGGGTLTNNSTTATSDFYMFDPANKEFTQITDFAGGTINWATAFSLDGYGYVGAGSLNVKLKLVINLTRLMDNGANISISPEMPGTGHR